MLRATTACTFSTSQLPKVVRAWCVLYILTSKCASRHNGVQLFISHLATWLFRVSGATNRWKNTSVSRLCYLFAHLHLLSSHAFSPLIFSLLLFSSLTLPTSAFSSVHSVGSLTSKLPSISSIPLGSSHHKSDIVQFCGIVINPIKCCITMKNHYVFQQVAEFWRPFEPFICWTSNWL